MKAHYKNQIIAESAETMHIENHFYFPVESVNMDYLEKHNRRGACENQGDACYYDIKIDGKLFEDAASSFSRPIEAASSMEDFIVFGAPVEVIS